MSAPLSSLQPLLVFYSNLSLRRRPPPPSLTKPNVSFHETGMFCCTCIYKCIKLGANLLWVHVDTHVIWKLIVVWLVGVGGCMVAC